MVSLGIKFYYQKHKERWRQLCELVADERDPARFSELAAELLRELKNKDERLKQPSKGTAVYPLSSEGQKR